MAVISPLRVSGVMDACRTRTENADIVQSAIYEIALQAENFPTAVNALTMNAKE